MDNGSLAPSSTQSLRAVAAKLQASLDQRTEVWPVSARISDRVPAAELGGCPALRLETALKKYVRRKGKNLVILPFFFANSDTVTQFVPETLARLGVVAPVAAPLLPDMRVCAMLCSHVRELTAEHGPCPVLVVDHGSPTPEVSAARDEVVLQMRRELGSAVSGVCMEKRPECHFNGPLLEEALQHVEGRVIVALLFLQPGRHAGPGGDIEQIIARASQANPLLQCHWTPLLGQNPLTLQILRDRYLQTQTL